MSNHLSFKFYIFIISFLLSVNCKIVASLSSLKGLKKILIQSSNMENFSFLSLSSADDQDRNDTWKAAEFQLHNISSILSEYPAVVSRPLPFKNSSRYFFSKGKSASLTVTLKSFRQGILFLNFSYFIGKTVTKESEISAHHASNETTTTIVGNQKQPVTGMEATRNINSTHFTKTSGTMKEIPASNFPTKVPELNQSSLSSVSISISSTPKTLKMSEPLPIKLSVRRKRRSVLFPEHISNTPNTQVMPSVSREEIRNGKSNEMVTLKPINADGNTSELSTSIVTSNASMTNAIDSLTLKQAVEMIKSAAAVISKSAAVPESTTSGPGRTIVNTPGVTQTTGRTVISSNSKISHKNNNVPASKFHPKAAKMVNEVTPRLTTPRIKHKAHSTAESNTKSKGMADTKKKRIHHKSRNGSNNNSKSEKKKRKSKSKKIYNVERTEKDENFDDNGHKRSSSSSSSSSEEDEDEEMEEGRKPKISYKMWRASLEKKNRPSGLYVTVNDDIIFDNWDGIWDKHYVLGKWTGSKPKALFNGKWNQTNLFMNWDDVPVPRDVKIIFEWEPLQGDFELILSDIDISTIVSPEDPCTSPPIQLGKTQTEESQDKFNFSLSSLNGSDNQSSIIVLKQNRDGEGNWEIIKMNNGDEPSSGKIRDLDLFELPENTQVKKNQKVANPEDILKVILEKWHDKDFLSTTQTPPLNLKASSTPSHTENATTTVSVQETKSVHHADVSPVKNKPIVSIDPTPVQVKLATTVKITEKIVSSSTRPPLPTSTPTSAPDSITTVPISTTIPTSKLPSSTTPTTTTISTESTTTEQLTTTTSTTPLPTSTIFTTKKTVFSSTSTTVEPQEVSHQEKPETKIPGKGARQRKTDNWTALLVSIFTGSIALTILIMIVKKRIDISLKGKNAVR